MIRCGDGWRDPTLGDLIYPHCSPQSAGKVIKVIGDYFVVQKPNGEVYKQYRLGCRGFLDLIDNHKKKLNTHLKLLAKIKRMK